MSSIMAELIDNMTSKSQKQTRSRVPEDTFPCTRCEFGEKGLTVIQIEQVGDAYDYHEPTEGCRSPSIP